MGVRENKKLNFGRIYSQVVKHGRTIAELAEEYGYEENAFIARMEKGFDSKIFPTFVKAGEKNLKHSKVSNTAEVPQSATEVKHKEEKDMAKRYWQKQATNALVQKEQQKAEKNRMLDVEAVRELENKKKALIEEISEREGQIDGAKRILFLQEEEVSKKQREFDKASKAFDEAKEVRDRAKKMLADEKQELEQLEDLLKRVESKISELKSKAVYLIAPGFTGTKPAFGTFYSTANIEGWADIKVVDVAEEYAVEPDFKEMMVSGYDSCKEYMEALRFVTLCVEYTLQDVEHTVLVSDERIKRLLKKHIG